MIGGSLYREDSNQRRTSTGFPFKYFYTKKTFWRYFMQKRPSSLRRMPLEGLLYVKTPRDPFYTKNSSLFRRSFVGLQKREDLKRSLIHRRPFSDILCCKYPLDVLKATSIHRRPSKSNNTKKTFWRCFFKKAFFSTEKTSGGSSMYKKALRGLLCKNNSSLFYRNSFERMFISDLLEIFKATSMQRSPSKRLQTKKTVWSCFFFQRRISSLPKKKMPKESSMYRRTPRGLRI